MIRTASRLGLETTIRAARLPLDLTARALGRSEQGFGLAIERADARVRALAGVLLADPDLQDDAARRHAATDERVRALRLRERADDVTESADERAAEKEAEARRRRAEAAADAEQRKKQAERERRARQANAAQTAQRRKAGSQRAKAAAQADARESADEARLDALEEKAEALEEREEALIAEDEAERLSRAAARAKSRRKS